LSRRRRRRTIVLLALLAVVVEVVGRTNGLHHPVVYEQTEYGYRALPNQDLLRFGNRIRYNEFGLRNDPITPVPGAGVARILCVGDSVANGGAVTDQEQTIAYQLAEILGRQGSVEVLNASAPGWALGNELGWLRNFGTFGSQRVVLIISTHDLFQEPAAAWIAGSHPSFTTEPPVLALQNLFVQYLLPRAFPYEEGLKDPGADGVESSERLARQNRENVLAIAGLVRGHGADLTVVFLEQEGDSSRDPTTLGAKRTFFGMMAQHGIPVVTLGREVETIGRQAMFRDDVHPNADGNRTIAAAIARQIRKSEIVQAGDTRPLPE
jgi:hypothetical protein